MPTPKRRASCGVCNRQSKQSKGLRDFTCFSCGWSYNDRGQADHTHHISKKKLYQEFQHAGITLSDGEVDRMFMACHAMSNRKDLKITITFQSQIGKLIEEYIARGWTGTKRNRRTGILNPQGKKISREI